MGDGQMTNIDKELLIDLHYTVVQAYKLYSGSVGLGDYNTVAVLYKAYKIAEQEFQDCLDKLGE